MKVNTATATGKQLDWGVAKALELKPSIGHNSLSAFVQYKKARCDFFRAVKHTDPAFCMGLIEQYKPDVVYRAEDWGVEFPHNNNRFWSPCLARAVARCVIDMKLGDEFECPDELEVQS